MKTQNISNTITLKNKVVAHHISDGSELVPAEVKENIGEEDKKSLNKSSGAGYKVDDEGIVNNYAIEPDMSLAQYPSPEQQKVYVSMGGASILLVAITLLTSFAVS
jgi:hypothetical protein